MRQVALIVLLAHDRLRSCRRKARRSADRPHLHAHRRRRRPRRRTVDVHGRDDRGGGDPPQRDRALLVLMDEIGRGTSTFDGLALAGAIARHLHEKNRAVTLFATHYFELTELAAPARARARTSTSTRSEHKDGIVFLHELEAGPATAATASRWRASPACRRRCCARRAPRSSASRPSGSRASRRSICSRRRRDGRAATVRRGRGDGGRERSEFRARRAIAALDPDILTPREALDALYRLKALQREPP